MREDSLLKMVVDDDLRFFTTTTTSIKTPLILQMTQAIASTAKAIGIGVGSLSVIAYLALWGGQRQVNSFPLSNPLDFVLSLMLGVKVGISFKFPCWITYRC